MHKLFIVFLFLIPFVSFSQHTKRCGTYEYWEMMKQQDPSLAIGEERINREANEWMVAHRNERGQSSVITIPVVVHVLYHTDAENISDAQIQSQIDVLNQDFARLNQDTILTPFVWRTTAANTGLQFCLTSVTPDTAPSTGIERRYTSNESWSNFNEMKSFSTGGLDVWNRDRFMNIWVGNLDGGVLGLTQMPGGSPLTDGMCISYKAFGKIGDLDPQYNLGRSATHETGHWLGLYHIWGDDGGACSGTDYLNDTPNQADNTFNCPPFPQTDECSPAYPGIMFMNYMDYSDDACMNIFTNDQSSKMHAILNTTRVSILNNVASCNGSIAVSLPIKLFPNPVTDEILIHTYFNIPASIDFSLKDLYGREIMHKAKSLSSYEKVPFDVRHISSGVYVVSVTSNNYTITEKVIIAHR